MSDGPVSLLPSNATPIERALDLAVAARIEAVLAANAGLWNPATCPLAVLPWLAWAFSVDVWDSAWSEAKKRAVVAASLDVHRRKGTRGAVERALAAQDIAVTLTEWFEDAPPADPYTFRALAQIPDEGLSATELRLIVDAIAAAKNLRSWLTKLTLARTTSGAIAVGGAPAVLLTATLANRRTGVVAGAIGVGGGVSATLTTTLAAA